MLTTGYRGSIVLGALLVLMSSSSVHGDTLHAYDDGVANITLGPPRSFAEFGDIDMLWGNYFFTDGQDEFITSVSFGLGDLSEGNNVSIWIFDDPDDDADPTNAVPVFSAQTTGMNLGFDFNVFETTPTLVQGGFFVAIGHLAVLTMPGGEPDYPSPARFDPDGRPDRSWFFYDDDIPENDLASSGFVQRMDGPFVPIQGAFAVRAVGVPVPEPTTWIGMCLGLGLIGVRRRSA